MQTKAQLLHRSVFSLGLALMLLIGSLGWFTGLDLPLSISSALAQNPVTTYTLQFSFDPEQSVAEQPAINIPANVCSVVTDISQQECSALEALFNSTNGNGWITKTNWLQSSNACSWFGVGCAGGRVVDLVLINNNLNGTIPPDIGKLTNLRSLRLSVNQLSGMIPPEIGNLTQLDFLSFFQNRLTGAIPAQIGNLTKLTVLSLPENQLEGAIPDSIGNLIALKWLRLNRNRLSGALPASLGNLSKLEELTLAENQLSGSIPDTISHLTELKQIILNHNRLSGAIPASLGNLLKLEHLVVGANQLSGPIPSELGNLQQLQTLYLWNNRLTGIIPKELGQLQNLQTLYLNSNQLTGTIPSELGQLTNLTLLQMDTNGLTGTLPPEIGNLTKLMTFTLFSNQISGSIPDTLGDLTELRVLGLNHNRFSGVIPTSLGKLLNLNQMVLAMNQFSGPIPPTLGNLRQLRDLSLWSNQLTGTAPKELGQLLNLQKLYLYNNQLSGSLPKELGELLNLQFLDLYNNQLTGSLPKELGQLGKLSLLSMGANQLTGAIPPEIGNLTGLITLSLPINQLSGEIPARFGELSSLAQLNLWHNQLSGSIPASLGNLSNLQKLYLGENKLTSAIPPELGNLPKLTHLHLSQNQLTGPLPSTLGSLTNLQELRIDVNPLSGALPQELINLGKLTRFYFDGTNLCELKAQTVQNWLNRIPELLRTNIPCLTALTVGKSITPERVAPSVIVSVKITVSSESATTIVLTESLPISLTYMEGSATGGLIYRPATRQFVYSTPITPSDPLLLTYQAVVNPSSPPGSIFDIRTFVAGVEGQTVEKSVTAVIPDQKTGTLVLIYVVADNDLGDEAIRLINNAEKAVSLNPTVVTAVMLDGPYFGDPRVYYLRPDPLDLTCPNYLDHLCDGRYQPGENVFEWREYTASTGSLRDFIVKSIKAHPNVKRVVLSLVGHGSGWGPDLVPAQPRGIPDQPGGLLLDQQPSGSLSTAGLRVALQEAKAETGKTISLLYLDACLMAMTEVAYELADSAHYLLASESLSWATFPYEEFLTIINDSLADETVGQQWLQIAKERLLDYGDDYPFTFSLINLQQIRTLQQPQNDLVTALRGLLIEPTAKDKLATAVEETQCFDSNSDGAIDLKDTYCDLYNFSRQLRKHFPDHLGIIQATQALTSAINAAVSTKANEGGTPWWSTIAHPWDFTDNKLGGLSIYMPLYPRPNELERRFYTEKHLQWAADTTWDDFLTDYWSLETLSQTLTHPERILLEPLRLQPTVKIRPEEKRIQAGDIVTTYLEFLNIPAQTVVANAKIIVEYQSSILQFNSCISNLVKCNLQEPGKVGLSLVSANGMFSDIVAAQIIFKAINPMASAANLSANNLNVFIQDFSDANGNRINPIAIGSSVAVVSPPATRGQVFLPVIVR